MSRSLLQMIRSLRFPLRTKCWLLREIRFGCRFARVMSFRKGQSVLVVERIEVMSCKDRLQAGRYHKRDGRFWVLRLVGKKELQLSRGVQNLKKAQNQAEWSGRPQAVAEPRLGFHWVSGW